MARRRTEAIPDPTLCQDCQVAPAEYRIDVAGNKPTDGLGRCRTCHERAVRQASTYREAQLYYGGGQRRRTKRG